MGTAVAVRSYIYSYIKARRRVYRAWEGRGGLGWGGVVKERGRVSPNLITRSPNYTVANEMRIIISSMKSVKSVNDQSGLIFKGKRG